MSTQTCCHLREVSLAWQLQASPMKSRSPVHCTSLKCTIAAVQVSSSSPPLLNASLSSAFSWHYRVPPDAGRCPAGSPGLPSSEAPTLRSPTGGSPGCTRVRGRSTGDGEDRRCTPPSHSPTAEEMWRDPRSPGASLSAGTPQALAAAHGVPGYGPVARAETGSHDSPSRTRSPPYSEGRATADHSHR